MLATIAGLSLLATSALAAPSLSLSLTSPASILDVEGLQVEVTLANSGDESLKLLNDPRSLLNQLETDSFKIIGADGTAPEFTGAVVSPIKSQLLVVPSSNPHAVSLLGSLQP